MGYPRRIRERESAGSQIQAFTQRRRRVRNKPRATPKEGCYLYVMNPLSIWERMRVREAFCLRFTSIQNV